MGSAVAGLLAARQGPTCVSRVAVSVCLGARRIAATRRLRDGLDPGGCASTLGRDTFPTKALTASARALLLKGFT